eukprot:4872182-Pyramimonas_sp.AAC.1
MGVRMAFGSDLLGENHCHQLEGLILQGEVQGAASALAAATAAAAELFQLEGKVGSSPFYPIGIKGVPRYTGTTRAMLSPKCYEW